MSSQRNDTGAFDSKRPFRLGELVILGPFEKLGRLEGRKVIDGFPDSPEPARSCVGILEKNIG